MPIKIDTSRYEAHHGKPKAKDRRHWSFTIVSPTITSKDKFWSAPEAMPYRQACERVEQIASLRRSELVILMAD